MAKTAYRTNKRKYKMTNTLGIVERTMAQLRDSTNTVNVIGGVGGRLSAYQPLTIRVTNHVADDGGVAAFVSGMALFHSKRHGSPFILGKAATAQGQLTLKGADAENLAATTLYPNFTYSAFV
jgi:hypothetical protein